METRRVASPQPCSGSHGAEFSVAHAVNVNRSKRPMFEILQLSSCFHWLRIPGLVRTVSGGVFNGEDLHRCGDILTWKGTLADWEKENSAMPHKAVIDDL